MQVQEIEAHLAELGQELQILKVQQPVRVLLVGGAFMLTQLHNRSTTNDIDVILKDVEDSHSSPLYRVFKEAVRQVASKNNLSNAWLNDVIGDFLRDASNVPEGTLWRKYGMLEVYIPSKEYILALKLLAGRQKDQNDILALSQELHIGTRQQAQQLLDRYISDKQVQQINKVDKVLARFFVG